MKLRVWLVCWLFTAAFVSPSSGWTQDTDMKQFRTILLKLKANKVDEETVNIISSLVTANLANYEVLELVSILKPKKTILTNLHIDLDYNNLKRILPKNIVPAYDGMNFKL